MRMCTFLFVMGWFDPFSEAYKQHRRKLFPSTLPERPTSNWKRERIYVCDQCIQAEQVWQHAHRSVLKPVGTTARPQCLSFSGSVMKSTIPAASASAAVNCLPLVSASSASL